MLGSSLTICHLVLALRLISTCDRLCGLVVPGCTLRGPGLDFQRYQIFLVAVDLERGPRSPCEDK
jgi:hypothetical protein